MKRLLSCAASVPENILALSVAIRGGRRAFFRMEQNALR